ncbi:MAG: hypothetical protein KG029_13770 [Bacteroidetes bacterium]|nr:hypothetical protein [Bacteroidota bacterium]
MAAYFGTPGWRKKKLEEDLDEIFISGKTVNYYFRRISLARMINRQCGGAVVAPWDVDDLPNDWLDAFRLLESDGQYRAAAVQRVKTAKADWLKKFKHYRQ